MKPKTPVFFFLVLFQNLQRTYIYVQMRTGVFSSRIFLNTERRPSSSNEFNHSITPKKIQLWDHNIDTAVNNKNALLSSCSMHELLQDTSIVSSPERSVQFVDANKPISSIQYMKWVEIAVIMLEQRVLSPVGTYRGTMGFVLVS
jgi:hypothetical protein